MTALAESPEHVPSPAAPASHGIGRLPALDGLRGLAVVAVLLFHGGFEWARGGWLGVSIFFTLSGFLITNLLVAEWSSTGTIALPTFWSRRFRRLMPAALAGLVGIALYGWLFASPEQLRHLRGDLLAALAYVANWRFLLNDLSYADLFAAPSPVQHFWSLAIEEQFYVVYPLVAFGALRLGGRRALSTVLAVAAAASLTIAVLAHTQLDRVYYGTDTRMLELLAGALFALWWSARPHRRGAFESRRARTILTAVGLVALAASLVLWPNVGQASRWVTRGVLPLQTVLSVMLIAAVARPTLLARGFAWRPLVGLGLISYGLYLYHWPIFLVLTPERTDLGTVPLFALRVTATLAVALASYHLLEQPVRRHRVLRNRRTIGVAVAGGIASVLVATLAVTWSPPKTLIAHADVDPNDRSTRVVTGDEPAVEGVPPAVLVVGDSGTYDAAPGIGAVYQAMGTPTFVDATFPGFGLTQDPTAWQKDFTKHVTEQDVQLTIVMLGGWDAWYVEDRGEEAYLRLLDQAVDIFTRRGGKVLWLGLMPESDGTVMNAVFRTLASRHPGVVAYGDVAAALQGPGGSYPRWLRDDDGSYILARKPDGWHVCPDGAVRIARAIAEMTEEQGWTPALPTGWETGDWRTAARYDDPKDGCDPTLPSNTASRPKTGN
jgi:peptidoglycan/LPS O-acetylase OafA/YrhL